MIATCGNEKSDDVLVKVDLSYKDDLKIKIESKVKKLFGRQIEKTVLKTLNELKIEKALIEIYDFGALDFVIKARLKTAISRAKGE